MFSKRAGKLGALAGVMVATTALVGVGTLSARADQIGPRAGCALTDMQCTYSSGWEAVSNNCRAQVTYTWWRQDDVMSISVAVKNTNLFVSCHAYGTPYLETTSGKVDAASKFYGFACGTWDGSCHAQQTWNYQVFNTVPSTDIASVDQAWSVLTTS